MMKEKTALAVTFSLLLEERAAVAQGAYMRSSHYSIASYKSQNCLCPEFIRLSNFAKRVLRCEPISKHRDVYDLFCKVAQAYHLKSWGFEKIFFSN